MNINIHKVKKVVQSTERMEREDGEVYHVTQFSIVDETGKVVELCLFHKSVRLMDEVPIENHITTTHAWCKQD